MDRKGFIFYESFWEAIKELPEKNQLELYQAITEYSFTGKINNEFIEHINRYGLDLDFVLNDSLGCIEYQKEQKISINLVK